MFWVVRVDRSDRWGPFVRQEEAKSKIDDMAALWPDSTFVIAKQTAKLKVRTVAEYV